MENLQTLINHYLNFCQYQKRLDRKTVKAYWIDLNQFLHKISTDNVTEITPEMLEESIAELHKNYKPRTVKRKIASVKSFFHYLEFKDLISANPFNKIQVKFREPIILPKTIPLHTLETFLSVMYKQYNTAKRISQKRNILRDIAVVELLFATGIRISELCSLKSTNIPRLLPLICISHRICFAIPLQQVFLKQM